jgi:hypothetical protein
MTLRASDCGGEQHPLHGLAGLKVGQRQIMERVDHRDQRVRFGDRYTVG